MKCPLYGRDKAREWAFLDYIYICIYKHMYTDAAPINNAARYALSKLLKCEGGAGAEGAILPYVGH